MEELELKNAAPSARHRALTIAEILRGSEYSLTLFSQHGDPHQQTEFGDAMQTHQWRGDRERARQEEVIISPGPRANWALVIPSEYARVEALLDSVGAPPL